MIIQKLINDFIDSTSGASLIPRLRSNAYIESSITGITDAGKGFFLSSLVHNQTLNKTVIHLATNSISALNLYYEVINLIDAPVFYFPGQEVSPYDQISSDSEIISHQTKTLIHLITSEKPCLIITTAKYLSEKLWNKSDLANNTFTINTSTKIEPLELSRRLISLGYKKASVVTGRGEFGLRGDVFDIYPLIGEPVRINFFGDEIESIKSYSTTTQRSIENIEEIIITPRYYVVNPDINKLGQKLHALCNKYDELKELASSEIEQIKLNTYSESLEYYSSILEQRDSSLFDYLPENTLFTIDDFEANRLSLENWIKQNRDIKNELETNKKIIPLNELLFYDQTYIYEKLKAYKKCYIEIFEAFDAKDSSYINLQISPQERFNNQIERFTQEVKKWVESNYKIIIFSEQPQRVKGILKEWEITSSFIEELKESEIDKTSIIISKSGSTNGFKLNELKKIILTDQEIFGTKRKTRLLHLKKEQKQNKYEYYSNIEDLKINDSVVHVKHGIGKFLGLVKISLDNNEREYLMIQYASDGKLYLPVEQINFLYRYRGSSDVIPKLSKLGGSDWELTKKKVQKAVKRVAEDLLNLYTARSKLEGFSFNLDSHWQIEMEEAFPYTETPDQWKAINEVKSNMEATKPMDRLICGDVGFGKTEVAIRAMFKAVLSGKQVAVLVPTTILAQQHFNVISERLAPYPVRIALLSRFRSTKEQKTATSKLTIGEIDIVIGTHRLLQKDINFKDLGLVVIDEEQRFGVLHKERLKQLRVTVDVLTLSATPIPRTLHMALSGARDLSLINTPPANRLPIKTFVGEFKSTVVKTAILHELERGGQVYFVHNRIETIEQTAIYLKELIPEASIAIAHGQMEDRNLENVMLDFLLKKFNVLVCTTIIESGLDIPNVNTIIIDNSDQMGLAQLYQLRGRVGRTDIQAHAYCFYPANKVLTETAKNRLQAIKEFSSLGSGYQIALRDMEIRGVGNILGPEQHGHMISVGFDLYCQLLNEAVDKLRGLEVSDLELDTVIDLNISAYIPQTYIEDERQKVIEYKRLSKIRNLSELEYIKSEWMDRFGNLTEEVDNLIKIVELRILASRIQVKTIKSEHSTSNIKAEINLRLDKWLEVQKLLPKTIIDRTTFKSNTRGRSDAYSFIMVKTIGLNANEQLNLLKEMLIKLKSMNIGEMIA
ncbi:MAG: transcription-repair coupling factor [Candidatus Melainabacteria bacterium]|nr:transcription-repair coupling factor [Candidatus Melainabacteria bacterium]